MNGKSLTYGALASFLLLLAPLPIATATAPQVKTPAPGYYRMMLGNFEVTALSDGTVDLKIEDLLTNTTAAKIRSALARAHLKDPVETSVNTYLVNTGSKLVMIDAGAGVFFGPTLGKLIANLKASGYQPEQVDEIYITHMHSDHVGGLVDGDKIAFQMRSCAPTGATPTLAQQGEHGHCAERSQTGFRRRDGVY